MRLLRKLSHMATLLASLAAAGLAQAAPYPERPIELVVPSAAGGGTDTVARAFGEAMRKYLPQPLTVVNKPGASGAIGMTEVARAKPDGYKLGIIIAEAVIVPHLGPTTLNAAGLVPIARLNADPSAITVKADSRWNTIDAFLKFAAAHPGEVQVGNSGPGSIWHLAATALEDKAHVRFNHVPFSGAAPALVALMGGHIDAVAVSPAEVSAYVAAGRVRTLAVMADQRVKGFENVPTLREQGIDLSIGTWRGLAAPKGTPPEVLEVLAVATRKAVADPVFVEALRRQHLGIAYADAATFKAMIAADDVVMKGLVAKTNLKR
ncbi:ABC transporter substrate-binding protein [Cupriavidus sp. SK-3]|uniref:tripartite tricarboxylate transporter substrate binding protein n=1 Tax=Cupriavidus TaxID=106589 RepID=UPI00044664D4|nr:MULTISPECIES: tripartite tricarboxylate transporter substrate binding protein [Cupriavidus]KDP83869.1 ABC transporter substrate-binding protein [Cupriavidus sp. SK-3]MDF3888219.1 tripartite tricarboxylate transporter substrate binding protein [Cupriavidus basilensis]